jgi:hypothetical protein
MAWNLLDVDRTRYSMALFYMSTRLNTRIKKWRAARTDACKVLTLFGSFVKKLKRKNIITDAEALRKDYPQISPMTEIKSLKTKL